MSSARQSHILVVNHSQEILDLMRELLEREGYRVSTLPDIEQDLDRIVELDPDLIVIDYMWPSSGNEWTLLNLITIDPRTTDIPVVVCTAAVRHVEEMRGHLERIGVRVVHKPFNISDLLEMVAASLDEATVVESAQADGLEGQPMS